VIFAKYVFEENGLFFLAFQPFLIRKQLNMPLFFNLFAATELPQMLALLSHGTLCNGPSVYIATTR